MMQKLRSAKSRDNGGPSKASNWNAAKTNCRGKLSRECVGFDRLGRVRAREQIIHCLILTGEREP
jgi:hypothetical protein